MAKKQKPRSEAERIAQALEDIGSYRLCEDGCWGRCRQCPADVVQEAITYLRKL